MMKRNKRRMFRPNRVVTAGLDVTPGRMQQLQIGSALLVIGLLVSACGGGGGGGGVMSGGDCTQTAELGCISETLYNQKLNQTARDHRNQEQFSNQWGLATIKADQAWAHLELLEGSNEPGLDVTVGVVDTGIDKDHPAFAGKDITEDFFDSAEDEAGTTPSHGTAVASVIAAVPDPDDRNSFSGVAPGADLHVFAIPSEVTADTFETILGSSFDILNLSFAPEDKENVIGNFTSRDELYQNSGLSGIIDKLENADYGEKILVWAAGNNGSASSVQVFAGLPVLIPKLRGRSIAVVAVNQNGDIASFSNPCGVAEKWCIAAPGVNVRVAYFGPNEGQSGGFTTGNDGTSFAAPMVSGGLALLNHRFRGQMPKVDLVKRLFDTANKNGKYGEKPEIYGQGLMDLGAATSPQGATMVASGNTVGGAGISLQQTNISLGGALGDGLSLSLAGQEIAAFDSLGAPFWFKLSGFTGATRGPSSLVRLGELMEQTPIMRRTAGRLTTFTPGRAGGAVEQDLGYARLRVGLVETPAGVQNGHFGLARNATTFTLTGHNGMTATAFTTSGFIGRAPASGASLSWRPFDIPIGFRAGWLAEQETLLGTVAAGAFGRLSADAMFAGLETGFEVGQWQLSADAELGTAVPRLQSGIISRMSSLTTSAFALHASRQMANGGSVRISFSQPLRVEAGRAALSVPIGRTKAGDVLRSSFAADLTPSGRQFDVSAQWRHPLADGGDLRFDATWMRNPGHNANAQPAVRLLAGLQFEF